MATPKNEVKTDSAFVEEVPVVEPRAMDAFSHVAAGKSAMPREMAVSRGGTPPTKATACDAFQLMFDPRRWVVLGGKVVPSFKTMKFTAGINGVEERILNGPNGSQVRVPSVAKSRSWREENGQTPIPFDAIPRAHVGRADLHQTPGAVPCYLWQPAGRPDVNLLIYVRCYPGSEQLDTDVAAYVEFCEALRDEHRLIGRCPPYVLRTMLDKAQESAGKYQDQASRHPHMAGLAKAALEQVAVLEAELERVAAPKALPAGGSAAAPVG